MSDVRSLLKAKRQEIRINHPYASYNASGQLKCSICGTIVKHASAWEGHLGSKAHRTNVIRLREEERQQQERLQLQQQQQQQEGEEEEEDMSAESSTASKRKVNDKDILNDHTEKKRKIEKTRNNLPTNFFSDPSLAPVRSDNSDDNDEDGDDLSIQEQNRPRDVANNNVVDKEYERFQRELMDTADPMETYHRATIVAEPVSASTNVPGFTDTNAGETIKESAVPTEQELRRKREQEEKELIMDRLLEEERAQEDADTRVLLLRNKVDLLRKKRQEAKVNKSKGKTSV